MSLITLLTHQRERDRKSNTGQLVKAVLQQDCRVVVWDRVNPDKRLLEIIKLGYTGLLYPGDGGHVINCSAKKSVLTHFIVLDGTWQEAQKMYNHSPYLQLLPTIQIQSESPSQYHLRRNQKPFGLCTAESVIAVLQNQDRPIQAAELRASLMAFL
ncbi:MAG: DTW domain-containing protein [Methylococcales bacterium]|jgi:DTW domain-containing protein|nr:DTW domain-containing protein [Methylococcales bacterium]MBT7445463.1 DTW domain-containing protein [Methylococcales bacterium]